MVLGRKTNFFLGKKMVLGGKTNFFLGKTKRNPKNHLLGNYAAKLTKRWVFWFSLGKRWFWAAQNQLFPRKKMVFLPKTIFFLGKRWFFWQKTNFFLGKNKKPKKKKKHLLGNYAQNHLVFLGKSWFWAAQNQLFPRKKMVFLPQTIFLLGKSWIFCPKPSFSLGKTKKKTIFLESGPIVSQEMVLLVFPRKKLVFYAKPSFS